MKKEITNLPASVRARLFNRAKAEGRSFNEVLHYYAMERFLFRLAASPHAEEFVLKGALMLQFWGGPQARSTRDIDLMGRKHVSLSERGAMIQDCLGLKVEDDGMRFDPATLVAEEIRTGARYDGVRIRFHAFLGTARVHLQVDVGFGDVVTPGPVKVTYPTLLEFPSPILLGYTPETTIAEKVCAMVSLDLANTRLKDLFDLWLLARTAAFRESILTAAIRATFARRNIPLPGGIPVGLTNAFSENPVKQVQWAAFLRKSRLAVRLPLSEVVAVIAGFLGRPLETARSLGFSDAVWKSGGPWSNVSGELHGPSTSSD